jgi:hypothetical protein
MPTQQDAPLLLLLPVDHRSPEQLAGAVLDHASRLAGERLLSAADEQDLLGRLDVALTDPALRAWADAVHLAHPLLAAPSSQDLAAVLGQAGQRALESASLCAAELRLLEALPEASQGVLGLSPLDAYRSDAPPLEVLELVLAHAHMLLVWLAIREAARRQQALSPWLGEMLGGAILRGLKARLILFASAGFPVPETLVARAERLDLGALFDQERQGQEALRGELRAHADAFFPP